MNPFKLSAEALNRQPLRSRKEVHHAHPSSHQHANQTVLQLLQQKSGELSPKIKGVAMVTLWHFGVDLSRVSAVVAWL